VKWVKYKELIARLQDEVKMGGLDEDFEVNPETIQSIIKDFDERLTEERRVKRALYEDMVLAMEDGELPEVKTVRLTDEDELFITPSGWTPEEDRPKDLGRAIKDLEAIIQKEYLSTGLGYEGIYLVVLHYFDESGEWKLELVEKE
jgi:hypothetical protein